ncbi:G-protein coupled receptor 87-like [Electrophorus electricus]|uniref:G-protein coupled receptors family 1 profile domain-containing protein n=2 Tax=Electrophorus TaxID=8004 RepID=A0A4W4HSA9_ELEEL|nr:G-protein coupled receptor 87-like [Electrophorus electricus]XP_026874899.2 G-protein coupled receptor 87-like [Electrophorus electricus]
MALNCTASLPPPSWTFASLYLLVFITSLLLNCTAAWVFFQIHAHKKTFALYLRNMLAADLLMTLVLPVTIATEAGVGPWWLRSVSCRYTAVLFYCCMYVNILFLGLLALDRYLKIVRPFGVARGSCLYNYSFTRAMAAFVWLAMGALSFPNSILTNQEPTPETAHCCPSLKCALGLWWHELVVYVNTGIFSSVLITLLASYACIYRQVWVSSTRFVAMGRQKPKSQQNILVVVVVFFLCFVPYHLWRIPFTRSQTSHHFSREVAAMLMEGKKITSFLSTCNVCLDPIIYLFMCQSFRSKLAEVLRLVPREAASPDSGSPTDRRRESTVLRLRECSSLV